MPYGEFSSKLIWRRSHSLPLTNNTRTAIQKHVFYYKQLRALIIHGNKRKRLQSERKSTPKKRNWYTFHLMQTLETTTQKLETFKEAGCRNWTGLALVQAKLNVCLTLCANRLSSGWDGWPLFPGSGLYAKQPSGHHQAAGWQLSTASNFLKVHLLFSGNSFRSWRLFKKCQEIFYYYYFSMLFYCF